MTTARLTRILSWASAIGFLGVAALHGSAYGMVLGLAREAPDPVRRILSVLWLAGSADLVALGLVLAAVAGTGGRTGALVTAFAALSPLSIAALQLTFLRFSPPTAMLLVLGALTLAAAALKAKA